MDATTASSRGSSAVDVNTTSSSSIDSAASVNAGDSDKSVSSNSGDSCAWYDDGECTRPRTCADCLNVLLSTDSCAVDPRGACVSMSQYESYLANRYYYTPLQRYFPSSEYTYCSANDSVCATCSEQWNANFASTGSAGMSSYCTGTDGCVCIADCEIPDWKDTVINDQCTASGSGSGADSGSSMATRITVSIFVGVAVAVFLAFATWGVRRFINRRQYGLEVIYRETRTRPRPPPAGPQLSLSGWKSLRQNLIDSEHGFIGSEAVTLQRNAQGIAQCTGRFHAFTMNASSNSTASLDVDVGEDSPVVTKTISSNSADSCTWYAGASCKRPRTCYDCLNVKVASGECAIMPNGMCVSLAEYSHYFSTQQELGIFYKYYSSSKYTYCSVDDSACVVFGVLLGLWGIKLLLKRREIGRGRGSSIPTDRETWILPRRPRTGPQLALTGWKELRENLIAIEKEVYGGAGVAQGAIENLTAADVPNAAMEEGSAYYPVSPTQRRPRDASRLH
ncbi:hypothetical protein JG688_00006583 [Phytophthora aleatoria]|uniref:Uncharacterized protein n=1 Tax=Phytophthora aleatoria TaxID=2496075 RepID=A0A8J5M8R9_9STRA|nr:hypothetical protein JG688_00006583 [Phytophthora aleatoria]